jgi:hypothetical protein
MTDSNVAYDLIPETVADALNKWHANEMVFSVEMGGLGPGYEMAIQGLAFELMREFETRDINWTDPELNLDDIVDAVVHRCNDEPWGHFSGAQVGAATDLAANVCRRGYRVALRSPTIVPDRLIQVCKLDLRK